VKLLPNPRALPSYALAASLLVCFGVWRWAEYILVPANTAHAHATQRPIGNNSDLYPRWLGTRELLLHGRDPYSAEVTREIQQGFYGRPLDPNNPSDPKDQVGFAYPLYVIFLLAPTVVLPLPTVLKIFQWLVLLSLAGSVPLWMSAIGFSRGWLTISGMVLALSTYAAVLEWHQQNLAVLVVLMLAGAAAATVRFQLMLGGFLLALSTIKPQLSVLFIVFFMLWVAGHWEKRQRLFWSFIATLLALLLAAEKISPGWMGRFLTALRAYQAYAAEPSVLQALLPPYLANLAAVVLVGFLLLHCWRWRKAPAGSEQFGWALAWAASVTLTAMPKLSGYNQPLLIPALLVLLAHREAIWKTRLLPRALTKGVLVCLLWQWGTALILALGSLMVPPSSLQPAAGVPEYTLLALPPMTLLAVVITTVSLGVAASPPPSGVANPQTPAALHG
jgi:hypothetical protein